MTIKKFDTGDVVWFTGNIPFSVVEISDFSYIKHLPFGVQENLRYDKSKVERQFELKVNTFKEVKLLFDIFKDQGFTTFIAHHGKSDIERVWFDPFNLKLDYTEGYYYHIKDLFINPAVYSLLIVHVPKEDFKKFVYTVNNLPGYKTWGTMPGGKYHIL